MAIQSQQIAMNTTSQNIANAETPGYSRQRANLVTAYPLRLPYGSVGTGVTVDGIDRMRDTLLDFAFRKDVGNAEAYSLKNDLLGEVEQILGEPSASGMLSTLDQFWSSWSDLSNNPSSAAAQALVKQRGSQVTYAFNTTASRIDDLTNRTRDRLQAAVGEVNALGVQLADLNGRVTVAEVGGNSAPDLRDQRDRVADQLAKLAGTRAEGQSNGTMSVYVGGMSLVDGNNARTLEVQPGPPLAICIKGDPDPLSGVQGTLQTMLDFVNTEVPAVRARLDELARGVVNGVNEYHASGWTTAGDALGGSNWVPANGPTGSRINFFATAGTTAATMKLSAEVLASSAVIASGDVQNAPGNNNIALALGALRDDNGMAALSARMGAAFAGQIGFAAGTSFADHFGATVTDLALTVNDAAAQTQVFSTLATQADNRRASVNGVSLDEELTMMLRHQQAYVAASKLVTMADEMAQTILNMV